MKTIIPYVEKLFLFILLTASPQHLWAARLQPTFTASDVTGTMEEDGGSVTITLTASHSVRRAIWTYSLVTEPAHGLAALSGDTLTYTLTEANWNGAESFSYQATDNRGIISTAATITIEVTPVAEPWPLDQLSPDPGALTASDSDGNLTITINSDDCLQNEVGLIEVGPDPAGDYYAVFGDHFQGLDSDCHTEHAYTKSFKALNLRTGEQRVIVSDVATEATPLALNTDAFQGFVVPLTTTASDNGGALMFVDFASGSQEVRYSAALGAYLSLDTSAALIDEDTVILGSINPPPDTGFCNNDSRPLLDDSGCGAIAKVKISDGSLIDIVNRDDGIRNWISGSPIIDMGSLAAQGMALEDGDALPTSSANARAIVGTAVGYNDNDEMNGFGEPCSALAIDPSTMNIEWVFDPGSDNCSYATASSNSEAGTLLDSAVSAEAGVPGISAGTDPANATYWLRLFGDADNDDGSPMGSVYQIYRADGAQKCEGTWPAEEGSAVVNGFYNGLVNDEAGNAYFTGIQQEVIETHAGSVTRTFAALMQSAVEDCAITTIHAFDGRSASSPVYAMKGEQPVLLVASEGSLYVFDQATLTLAETFALATSNQVISAPLVSPHTGTVTVMDIYGNVTILANTGITDLGKSSWPRFRGNNSGTAQFWEE